MIDLKFIKFKLLIFG